MKSDYQEREEENEKIIDLAENKKIEDNFSDTWTILIVNDEVSIHEITKSALRNFTFEQKSLNIISAYSNEECKQLIKKHPDFALVILDVFSEKEQTGTEIIDYIRNQLNNQLVQIILGKKYSEKKLENVIVFNDEINDDKNKIELTIKKIVDTVFTGLTAYKREIELQKQANNNYINIQPSWSQLFTNTSFKSLILKFKGSTTSALPKVIKENPCYQKALNTYFEQDFSSPESKEQAQENFGFFLLNLLAKLQEKFNQHNLINSQKQWNEDNWFLKLNRHQTEQILQDKQNRLLILSASPEISLDCPSSFHHNLKTEIRNGIGVFLENYYPLNSPICPVEYYGDYFQELISELDVKRLHEIFGSIATIIIYSEVTDYQVNLHAGFWAMLEKTVIQISVSGWNWEHTFENLKQQGQSEKQALRNIRKIIVTAHQLLAGFIADWYYLNLNLLYQPQLSKLPSTFPKEWTQFYLETLQETYNRNQGEIHYQRGVKLSQLENYTAALEHFNKVLERYPTRPKIFSRKGQILIKLKKVQEALDNFNKSLELNAKDVIALKGKGIALFNLLRSEEALSYFEQALELKPNDYETWTYRGHALYNLARLEQAIESYENALAIEPKYSEAINYRRSALHNLGREEKAFILHKEPSEFSTEKKKLSEILTPDSPQAWLDLGKENEKKEKWEEALHCFEQILKLEPNNYDALKGKGLSLFNLKNWRNAFYCFDQALKIKATNYRLWIYRGRTLYCLKRFAETIYSYNRALFINPNSEKALKERQNVMEKLKSIELKSECNIDYSKLRDLLALGQWKEADKETTNLILQVVQQGKKIILKLQFRDIEKFPVTDLQTIDKLWKIYSGGHFGFTVQKAIYENIEGDEDQIHDEQRWTGFARKVGWMDGSRWLSYDALTFSNNAPLGHLPRGPKFSQAKMFTLLLLKL